MTTHAIRAHATHGWTFPGLNRFLSVVSEWISAYSEALDQAQAARSRYPYAAE